jgi:para-aminobenzoate synthetase component 1
MRKSIDFYIPDLNVFRKTAASWASSFSLVAFFDSNKDFTNEKGYQNLSSFDILIAVSNQNETFSVHQLTQPINDWLFGHLSYECFHSEFGIPQMHQQKDGFPPSLFFIPEWIVKVQGNRAQLLYHSEKESSEAENELNNILNSKFICKHELTGSKTVSCILENEYIDKVQAIKKHISRGDVYEMNFCINFSSDNCPIDPLQT